MRHFPHTPVAAMANASARAQPLFRIQSGASQRTNETMQELDRQEMGKRLRVTRKALGLTLEQVSARARVSTAHVSKAERGQIALSYEKLLALAKALGIGLEALFSDQPLDQKPRVSVNLGGQGVAYETDQYVYGMLANDMQGKKMTPMKGRASARSVDAFAEYVSHPGEEFVLVLKGVLKVQFADGRAEQLKAGDSIYFDSHVGHLYLSVGKTDAEFIAVCCEP